MIPDCLPFVPITSSLNFLLKSKPHIYNTSHLLMRILSCCGIVCWYLRFLSGSQWSLTIPPLNNFKALMSLLSVPTVPWTTDLFVVSLTPWGLDCYTWAVQGLGPREMRWEANTKLVLPDSVSFRKWKSILENHSSWRCSETWLRFCDDF